MGLDNVINYDSCLDDCSETEYTEFEPIEMSIKALSEGNRCLAHIACDLLLRNDKYEESLLTAVRMADYGLAKKVIDYISTNSGVSEAIFILSTLEDFDLQSKKEYVNFKNSTLDYLETRILKEDFVVRK